LCLKGHERSITKIKYNREGDLLFSASKDKSPCVWFAENGERLGTYEGHNGVVWCLDVAWDSSKLITGSGDNYCILWDTEVGRPLHNIQSPTSVRTVGFSYSANLFFFGTDARATMPCEVYIFDLRDGTQMSTGQASFKIPTPKSKATSALWSHLDNTIITGHENGDINQYDVRMTSQGRQDTSPINFVSEHKRVIMDLQISNDQTMLLSASKDHKAKLFDAQTLTRRKTYESERPVNSAAMSPVRDHIVLGGGEEAMIVTQTDTRQGQFEAKMYHMVFEDEFARIKGHFGPINTLAFHPDGHSYASGAEDGMVRIQKFDQDYWDFDFDY